MVLLNMSLSRPLDHLHPPCFDREEERILAKKIQILKHPERTSFVKVASHLTLFKPHLFQ